MRKKQHPKKAGLYHYLLFIILTVVIGISSGWDFHFGKKGDSIKLEGQTIKEVFPEAGRWEEANENIFLILSGKDTIGRGILVPGNSGYGGRVPLFIGMQGDTITQIELLPNNETTEFMNYIKEDQLLARWEGVKINEISGMEVDAVSGATESSKAIIRGVRQGAARFLNEEQGRLKRDFAGIAKDLLFLLVVLFSLLMAYNKSMRKYRRIYLFAVLLVMGIYTGKVLSIKLLYGWLSKGVPWETNWQSTLLLIMALAMPLLKKPGFYCTYLCPMGALQELINKISPAKKRRIRLKKSPLSLREIYLTLILASLVLGFSVELSYLEPFMVFMYKVAGTALFVFVAVIAIMALFFSKPWCAFCPTGCLIDKVHNK
ncbi:MAG: FMN-binding protein [Bacteroidales bacterium]|nr:FMN-binding protein [Bacteroidales bacterium]